MDMKKLAHSLGITQQPAISRAAELHRLLKDKVPGSLGKGEICRPAICLELACQTTPGSKLPIRDEFIRFSCSPAKVYNQLFTMIQRILDVRPALDLRELVTLFGCSQLHDSAQQLLRVYKTRVLESLTEAERARADLTRPALLAAAFLLTVKKHRIRVDRPVLIAKMGLTAAELETALKDFGERCADQLVSAAPKKRGRDDKGMAPGDEANDTSEPERSNTDGGPQGGARAGAKRRRRAVALNEDAEDDRQELTGGPAAVAVDDFKLVLIGLGPSREAEGQGSGDGEATRHGLSNRPGGTRRKVHTRATMDQEAEKERGVAVEPSARAADVEAAE